MLGCYKTSTSQYVNNKKHEQVLMARPLHSILIIDLCLAIISDDINDCRGLNYLHQHKPNGIVHNNLCPK